MQINDDYEIDVFQTFRHKTIPETLEKNITVAIS